MLTTRRKVTGDSKLVDESGRVLEKISGSVEKVTDLMGEISAASREQAGGVQEISKAVSQTDEATQAHATR
jgi:methyl-accepting chemotaxis protein